MDYGLASSDRRWLAGFFSMVKLLQSVSVSTRIRATKIFKNTV
jgi:hypothetical protein